MRAEVSRLLNEGRQSSSFEVTETHLLGLPDPVQRYLRSAGILGKRTIRTAHLRQKGVFRRGAKWLPFTAEQWFAANPPGFVWQAQIRLLPLLSFSVTDMFVNGHGALQGKLLSVFKAVDASGPEIDQGELLRYLGEMAWFPTAFLSPFIEWESIGAHTAKVILKLPSIAVSALIHFNDESRPWKMTAQRYMEESGKFLLRPWSGQFSEYRQMAGLLIPTKARVTWHLDSGDWEYFRGDLTHIEYDI